MADTTKDILPAAARRLFSERGYYATTVRDIAGRVGITGASVYAHVAGKEDLLWQLVNDAADAFHARVQPVHAMQAPAIDKLRAAIRAHVAVITENLEAATIYFHEWKFLAPPRRRRIRDRRDAYEALFRDMLRQGINERALRIRDEASASILLLSSLNGIYTWYDPRGPLGADELGAMYADMLIDGLR
jgi:TetR/AcrR family transcriptional regulator, cholesterol catabolism regulator